MILKRIAAAAAACILISAPVLSVRHSVYSAPAAVTAYAEEDDGADYIDLNDTDEDDDDTDSDVERSSGKKSFNPVLSFIISLVIGLIIAFIAVGSMKSKLKSVHSKTGASDYKVKDSLKLNEKSDTFLYKKLEKSPRAQTNNRK